MKYISFGTDLHMQVTMSTKLRHPARLVLITIFVAKHQATSHSIKYLDMLLHDQQIMPHNGYICDV